MAKIVVVGLGPGSLGQMSLETFDLLSSGIPVYLRTEIHPCVRELRERGVDFQTFDTVYGAETSFEDVYRVISKTLLAEAKGQDILYAVPGHPRVAEQSVKILLELAPSEGVAVEVKSAMSFLDPLFTLLGIDPADGVNLVDGAAAIERVDYRCWTVIPQVYDRMLGSERKLDLMAFYPDEFKVFIVQGAGSAEERVEEVPLYQLDRSERFNHLTSIAVPPLPAELQPPDWEKLLEVMTQLRGKEGCPWDKEQTHLSLRPYLIEETYEVLEALDQEDMHKLCEELGDLLLQIIFHAQLAQERQDFNIRDVVREIVEKLVRRHPHVFAGTKADSAGEVVVNWEKIKATEAGGRSSLLDGLTKGLPALMYALKVQSRAAKVGFDWPDQNGPVGKIEEELKEFLEADSPEHKTEELGDILFSVVNLARFVDIDPELALRGTTDKFIERFQLMELHCREKGLELEQMSLQELNNLWEIAKKHRK